MSFESPPSQSLFERLPYDIRVIIYQHLKPDALPPRTKGFPADLSGFMLSCRLAEQELREELEKHATAEHAKDVANFKVALEKLVGFGVQTSEIVPNSTLTQLRQLTVTLPYTCTRSESEPYYNAGRMYLSEYSWKSEVSGALRFLFAYFFDHVRIHVCGEERYFAHGTMLDRGRHEQGMQKLLLSLMHVLDYDTSPRANNMSLTEFISATSEAHIAAEIWKSAPYQLRLTLPNPPEPPNKQRIKTKQISLSWDMRDDAHGQGMGPASSSILLNGKQHKSGMWTVAAENEPPYYFHHLHDEQRLVGRMSFTNEARWVMATRTHFSHLLKERYTTQEYVHSQGLGENICTRLHDIGKQQYEENEKNMAEMMSDKKEGGN
jgi:hypothetical protein